MVSAGGSAVISVHCLRKNRIVWPVCCLCGRCWMRSMVNVFHKNNDDDGLNAECVEI